MCVCLFVCLSSYLAIYLSIYGPGKKVCHFIGSVEHKLKDWLYHIWNHIYIHTCMYFTQIDHILDQCGQCHQPTMTGDGDDCGHLDRARCTIQNLGQIPMIQGKSHQKSPFFLSALYSHCLANIFNGHDSGTDWLEVPTIYFWPIF